MREQDIMPTNIEPPHKNLQVFVVHIIIIIGKIIQMLKNNVLAIMLNSVNIVKKQFNQIKTFKNVSNFFLTKIRKRASSRESLRKLKLKQW